MRIVSNLVLLCLFFQLLVAEESSLELSDSNSQLITPMRMLNFANS